MIGTDQTTVMRFLWSIYGFIFCKAFFVKWLDFPLFILTFLRVWIRHLALTSTVLQNAAERMSEEIHDTSIRLCLLILLLTYWWSTKVRKLKIWICLLVLLFVNVDLRRISCWHGHFNQVLCLYLTSRDNRLIDSFLSAAPLASNGIIQQLVIAWLLWWVQEDLVCII